MNDIPLIQPAVELTEIAAEMAIKAMENEGLSKSSSYLRIVVVGGGCSGLRYLLDFTDSPDKRYDQIFEQHGIKITVDYFSAAHLTGVTIDFADDITGTGFKFNNPSKNKKTCGCGKSFGYE